MTTHRPTQLLVGVAALMLGALVTPAPANASEETPALKQDASLKPAVECLGLAKAMQGAWPDPSTRVLTAALQAAGPYTPPPRPDRPVQPVIQLPEHCELTAVMHERKGADGQQYAIHLHLRLPTSWNGRFLFQGGGGSNGELGDALGLVVPRAASALSQGFAVVSQDSGHDNRTNNSPTRGGALAFGFDPQARADYGFASLQPVARAAKALVSTYYAKPARYSYFVGCSKGGQEGMMFAQRDPDEFDGILAAAPGFSLPRAAVAEAWDVQQINSIGAKASGDLKPGNPLQVFASALTDLDLKVAQEAVLEACDAADGLHDGMVADIDACTSGKVLPALEARTCKAGQSQSCLTQAKINALRAIFAGPRNAKGKALYSDWQWDAGIASPGWRIWKLGSADGSVPPLNVILGGPSLASVFTTPPTALSADPVSALKFQLAFDMSRDAGRIYDTDSTFRESAWHDIGANSTALQPFKAHGGKLLIPHGVSDPVFSVRDTIRWYNEVQHDFHGHAQEFVRVFPVPGMNHCGGGPATDEFDAFETLRIWVETKHEPDTIIGRAGSQSPWPGRSRPLCPYPKYARYKGTGDPEQASSFECR